MADPDLDEHAIAEGKIDAVVLGRQAIADPDFGSKLAAGHPEEVHPCIGCNQGCIWGYFTSGQVGCAVNADGSREALPADTVVLSLGYRPVKGLAEALKDCPAQVLEIGDGSQVGNVLTCIRDAYDAVASL